MMSSDLKFVFYFFGERVRLQGVRTKKVFLRLPKSLLGNIDMFDVSHLHQQVITLSIHILSIFLMPHHYCLYFFPQSKEAGIKTLVALDDQGGERRRKVSSVNLKNYSYCLNVPSFSGCQTKFVCNCANLKIKCCGYRLL